MFLVSLTYKVAIDEVDRHLSGHRAWLDTWYDNGVLLASGRKVPRTGGVLLMRGETRERIEAIVQEDPFHRHGVADYEITEVDISRSGPDLAALLD